MRTITNVDWISINNCISDSGHSLTSDTTTVRPTQTTAFTSGDLQRPTDDSLTLGLSLGLGLPVGLLFIITAAVYFW